MQRFVFWFTFFKETQLITSICETLQKKPQKTSSLCVTKMPENAMLLFCIYSPRLLTENTPTFKQYSYLDVSYFQINPNLIFRQSILKTNMKVNA